MGAVMFAGISRDELQDPHNPPPHAQGPFTISANNRFIYLCFTSFRRVICLEILQRKEHQVLHLFREFQMEVYCYPNPEDHAQVVLWVTNVFLRKFLLLRLGHPRTSCRSSTASCITGTNCLMRGSDATVWRRWVNQVLFTFINCL